MGDVLTHLELLAAIPQQEPFRFIDEIIEVDEDHIIAGFRFREDHDFYRGHFPGNPVTPGVILIEAMAQASVVALGLYILHLEKGREEAKRYTTMFTETSIEFANVVRPGDRVITTAKKKYFRRMKLCCNVEMTFEDGTMVSSGTISGMGLAQ